MRSAPEPFFLLLGAFVLDAVLGLFVRNPARPFDRGAALAVGELSRRLDRAQRSNATLLIRGLILAALLLAVAFAAGWLLAWFAARVPYGWVLSLVLLVFVIDQRTFFAAFGRTSRAASSAQDPATELRRGAESATLRYAEGVVAASFWFALLGVAGLLIYRAILVAALVQDRPDTRDSAFGFVSVRLHEAMAWIPLRLAAALIVFAACFTPGARPAGGVSTIFGYAPGHRVRSTAWPLSALAGTLGVALAGPAQLDRPDGGFVPWIEPRGARMQMTATDARRALYLLAVACILNALLVLVVAMIEVELRS